MIHMKSEALFYGRINLFNPLLIFDYSYPRMGFHRETCWTPPPFPFRLTTIMHLSQVHVTVHVLIIYITWSLPGRPTFTTIFTYIYYWPHLGHMIRLDYLLFLFFRIHVIEFPEFTCSQEPTHTFLCLLPLLITCLSLANQVCPYPSR